MPGMKVVIAMDGSSHCEYALQYYMSHFHHPENYVILLNAVELTTPYVSMGVGNAALTSVIDEEKVHAQKYLEYLQKIMHEKNLHGAVKQVFGPARTEILHVAEQENAAVIVTGSRGMGNVKRTILGSVSDHIIHHAHMPVLVCKHKDH